MMAEREENQKFRHFNIIPDIRRLGFGQYQNLEKLIKFMTDAELRDFKRFLRDVDGKMLDLKNKLRRGIF